MAYNKMSKELVLILILILINFEPTSVLRANKD